METQSQAQVRPEKKHPLHNIYDRATLEEKLQQENFARKKE